MSPTLTKTKKIPAHLKRYISKQNYQQYTPINQAVWRYVMRQNVHFFEQRAHPAYREGLKQSGIFIDRIPRVEEMDACLEPFGWGAVPIDGLIPGVAFFDFQAHGFLPIATDIRTLEHIQYTPAPDIIHEAAGHAPILCDPQYAEYVKLFGRIGAKALANQEEHEVFEATRRLSQIMEDPSSTQEMIKQAEADLEQKMGQVTEVSEATLISRLYWWTVEYGLIGDLDQPQIYGAGLLSSIGESQHCLSEAVKKVPFDLETCIQTDYDVTRPQPQLFVCRDFHQLIEAVQTFSERMAFRVGGTESLHKAVRSGDTATVEFSSGLQVSGTFTRLLTDEHGEAIYLWTTGPTACAFDGKEIEGHGKQTHADGFGAPIGKVKGFPAPLETLSLSDLHHLGIETGRQMELQFENGIIVNGLLKEMIMKNGRLLLLSFTQCTVTYRDQILFQPEWGHYDLAIGESIVSVFAGAADPEAFFATTIDKAEESNPDRMEIKPSFSTLDHLYQAVRDIREGRESITSLPTIARTLADLYPDDWLLRVEMLECLAQTSHSLGHHIETQLKAELNNLIVRKPQLQSLIENGLRLLDQPS